MVALVGIGHQVCQKKVPKWCAQILGRPGTDAQRVRPIGGVGGIDQKSR
jgi:hypothetical protein